MADDVNAMPRQALRWSVLAAALALLGVALVVVAVGRGGDGSASAPYAVASPSPSGTSEPAAAPPESAAQARPTTAAPSSAGAPLPRSAPERVRIPGLGVDSDVVRLGLAADGTMQVPDGAFPAGWYAGAPTPGSLGPAVVVGHVTWNGDDGVFRRLAELEAGDRVEVDRADGVTAVFEVSTVETYDKVAFPTEKVYGEVPGAALRLITCGGVFDGDRYSANTVVYADLVETA